MENNKFIIVLIILSFIVFPLFSQVNISFETSCPEKDCAILADAFVKVLGDSSVNQLLENKVKIGIVFKVDTLGSVICIAKFRSNTTFPKADMEKIEHYLINNNTRFCICYEKPFNDEKQSYDLIVHTNESIKKNNLILSAGFPGLLMIDYGLDSVNGTQSKIEYLKNVINKYLFKDMIEINKCN
jgi:hypothetical protein